MAWFLPPASPTVSGLASPHPTSQIKILDIIAAILMDTQHTWFIQPQLFKKKKSHYQFLLIIQPFRTTRTAREALLTTGARGAFFYVCVCACAHVCVCAHTRSRRESWPTSALSSWKRQIRSPEWGWPRLWLISPSHEEHWGAQNNVHKHKQVASS